MRKMECMGDTFSSKTKASKTFEKEEGGGEKW